MGGLHKQMFSSSFLILFTRSSANLFLEVEWDLGDILYPACQVSEIKLYILLEGIPSTVQVKQQVQTMLKRCFGHTTVKSPSERGLRTSVTTGGNTPINYLALRTKASNGGLWEVSE